MATPHAVLGLGPNATKDQVKEAFRKLVWQYHPDKCAPEARIAAEAKFKEIKHAYESILHREAGYRPPPPGAPPNVRYAEAYWHTHSTDGRVPWGQFAGYETEWQFYKAMIRGGRNNMALLTVMGLLAIPAIAAGAAFLQSPSQDSWQDETGPLDGLGENYVVNGVVTKNNPWAARNVTEGHRYREAQERIRAAKAAAAAAAEQDGAVAQH